MDATPVRLINVLPKPQRGIAEDVMSCIQTIVRMTIRGS